MVQWAFVGDHNRDAGYQASFDLIEPGSVVIDVGANIGLWSLQACRRAGSGSVHAFEPAPSTFPRLERNLQLNQVDNVIANRLAVDRESGTTTFHEAAVTNSGGAGYLRRPGALTPVTVERTTIDDYCRMRELKAVSLIKLDIEGAEWLALQGAVGLLRAASPPSIFMELDGNLTRQFGWEPIDVVNWLDELGYRTLNVGPEGTLVPSNAGDRTSRDIFAVHESRTP